jgi:hypothetical protein
MGNNLPVYQIQEIIKKGEVFLSLFHPGWESYIPPMFSQWNWYRLGMEIHCSTIFFPDLMIPKNEAHPFVSKLLLSCKLFCGIHPGGITDTLYLHLLNRTFSK